jgi:integrase
MLVDGVPLKAISDLLGHSSERFTQERYAHMVPALEAKVTASASARAKRRG